jgi:ketosteroid isomerase-like protein
MLIDENVSLTSSISAGISLQNAATISDLYEAFVDGDIEGAARFVSPDFVMHVPGTGRNAGEYWGVNGFRQFMSNIARHNGGVFDMEVPVFSVSGEHAFTREVIQINRAYDPDRIWTLRISNWMKMRAGRLSELWVIPEAQHEYDDYWTPPGDATPQSRIAVRHRAKAKLLHSDRATSPANHHLLASMYDAFWRGDAAAMRATIADNVVVNVVGHSGMSGVYDGWAGYMTFRERLIAMMGDKYKLDVIGMAASSTDAWAVEHIRMNRRWDPTVQEIRVLMHFRMEGGLIVHMDDFPLDTHQWESFYTPPTIAVNVETHGAARLW